MPMRCELMRTPAVRCAVHGASPAITSSSGVRLDPMKDHANLLQAAASFARENSDARFVCIGGGPAAYRLQLTALADSLGLADRVMWIRDIGDMKAAYSAFDIATLSSAFGEG